jgi:hypothetical protein
MTVMPAPVPISAVAVSVGASRRAATAGKAKFLFASTDPAVTTGSNAGVDGISVAFDVSYDTAHGRFLLPAGTSDGTAGWVTNERGAAKYVNKAAPGGPTHTKMLTLKSGKLLKLVGKGLGDTPLDVLGAGAPSGPVTVVCKVDNGGDVHRHCTQFSVCTFKMIAGSTGAKLACKQGTPAPCRPPPQ